MKRHLSWATVADDGGSDRYGSKGNSGGKGKTQPEGKGKSSIGWDDNHYAGGKGKGSTAASSSGTCTSQLTLDTLVAAAAQPGPAATSAAAAWIVASKIMAYVALHGSADASEDDETEPGDPSSAPTVPKFCSDFPLQDDSRTERRKKKAKIIKANFYICDVLKACGRHTFHDADSALAEIQKILDNISDSVDEAPAPDDIMLPEDEETQPGDPRSGSEDDDIMLPEEDETEPGDPRSGPEDTEDDETEPGGPVTVPTARTERRKKLKIIKASMYVSNIVRACRSHAFEDAGRALAEIQKILDNISESEDEAPAPDDIIFPPDQVASCEQQ